MRFGCAAAVALLLLALSTTVVGEDEDPWKVLGVPRNADAPTIKRRYRELARETHPDKNPDRDADESTRAFRRVANAYEALTDPEYAQRKQRERAQQARGRANAQRNSNLHRAQQQWRQQQQSFIEQRRARESEARARELERKKRLAQVRARCGEVGWTSVTLGGRGGCRGRQTCASSSFCRRGGGTRDTQKTTAD